MSGIVNAIQAGSPKAFQPLDIRVFRFVSCDFEESTGKAKFHYAFDDKFKFVEELSFDCAGVSFNEEKRSAIDACLKALHVILGISYFKAAMPPVIEVENQVLTRASAQFYSKLYLHGLGEFSYINKLDLRDKIHFPFSDTAEPEPSSLNLADRTIVPVGGGKDSVVSLEILRECGKQISLFSVGDHKPNRDIAAISGLPLLLVKRSLDPLLFELNSQGAYNGHVPISAIIAFILPLAGVLYDFDEAALSNERSANTGNLEWNGFSINHQYSKSLEFERDVSGYIKSHVLKNFNYFSMLRPFSDLNIGKVFSRFKAYHSAFVSCNRAFKIRKNSLEQKWCLECPKCHFVFLALAPFLTKKEVLSIFGEDLLDKKELTASFDSLLGVEDHRPFECVGEAEECTAAFICLTKHDEFKNDFLVRRFAEKILPQIEDPQSIVQRALTRSDEHLVPDEYLECLSKNF